MHIQAYTLPGVFLKWKWVPLLFSPGLWWCFTDQKKKVRKWRKQVCFINSFWTLLWNTFGSKICGKLKYVFCYALFLLMFSVKLLFSLFESMESLFRNLPVRGKSGAVLNQSFSGVWLCCIHVHSELSLPTTAPLLQPEQTLHTCTLICLMQSVHLGRELS